MKISAYFVCFILVFALGKNSQVNGDCLAESELNVLDPNLLIKINNGKLLGKDNGFFYSYESIPFAQAPVGELRFEAPKPYARLWDGVFDARRTAPVCMQWDQLTDGDDKLIGEEDCLMVSVFKPKRITVDEQLPVIALIHGGAFMFGGSVHYQHEEVMRRGQFIVVKISYRLGPLGFLSTQDDGIAGNFGLKDQRLALQWIKQNIAQFGGDPERVLVLGFSAGGASVHLHLMKRDLSQYVRAAVSVSGTALNPWVFINNARERAYKMGHINDCSLENSHILKECLQQKPAEDIVRAVREFLIFGYNPFTTFGPVVEDAHAQDNFITKTIQEQVQSGDVAKDVPWLATYTAEDGGYNAAELAQITANGRELIEIYNEKWLEWAPHALFFRNPNSAEARQLAYDLKQVYLGDRNFTIATYRNVQRMFTDLLFKYGVEEAIQLHKDIPHGAPVYAYRYDNTADRGYAQVLAKRNDIDFGCVHGDDMLLIFPNGARNVQLRADEKVNANYLFEMLKQLLDNGAPSFGPTKFIDNVGKTHLQLMSITGSEAESCSLERFP